MNDVKHKIGNKDALPAVEAGSIVVNQKNEGLYVDTLQNERIELVTRDKFVRTGEVEVSGVNAIRLDDVKEGSKIKVQIESKNLLPMSYSDGSSKTTNGVTFTVNEDHTVTANGTATDDALFLLSREVINEGEYTLSGCPSGGGNSTYGLVFGSSDFTDIGDGVKRIYTGDMQQNIFIKIKSGQTVNSVIFKPQLEKGAEKTPYSSPINSEGAWIQRTGKNLLQTANGPILSGLSKAVKQPDGSFLVTSPLEDEAWLKIWEGSCFPAGTYRFTGAPAGAVYNRTYGIRFSTPTWGTAQDSNDILTIPEEAGGTQVNCHIWVSKNVELTEAVFKPQIELVESTDFEPGKGFEFFYPQKQDEIESISPTTSLLAEGARITCTYKKDSEIPVSETIKTPALTICLPPTADTDAVNKQYVDDNWSWEILD